jgi:hypothetical protein
MMMGMAGKRLAAAGVLAAAVAATTALWVAQHAPLPSQLRAIRQTQATVTTVSVAQLRSLSAYPAPPPAQSPLGFVVAGGVLLGLVLVGTVLRPRREAVPMTARPPRRGRAPPSPGHRAERTRRN